MATQTSAIRDATEADLPGMLAIYNEVIRTSAAVYTEQETSLENRREWLAAKQADGFPVLVGIDPDDGSVLGYATFGDFRPWPGYRHSVEHSVHIRSDTRGRGLGTALVRAVLDSAALMDKHVMIAGIDAANAASIRLHERLGFEHAGALREVGTKFGRWLDLVFMQKILTVPAVSDG